LRAVVSTDDKAKLLADWREANWAELDRNLAVAREIRDDPKTPAKLKMEAVREINRLFGISEMAIKPAPKERKEEAMVTEKEEKRIQGIMNEFRQGRTS
jgi:hypothetical protein